MAYVREEHPRDTRPRETYTSNIESRDTVEVREREPRGYVREREHPHEEKVTLGTVTGGASLETLGGAAAVVLAIIGLTGNFPFTMAAISTIAIGGSLLAYGLAIAARWRDFARREDRRGRAATGSGVGIEVLAGAAGIALGILALVNVLPELLLQIAAIVFGGALMIGAAAQAKLAEATHERNERFEHASRRTMQGSGGLMVLAGAGAAVLGILGLIGLGTALTLTLVAMLVIGGALVVSGIATATKFGYRLREAT